MSVLYELEREVYSPTRFLRTPDSFARTGTVTPCVFNARIDTVDDKVTLELPDCCKDRPEKASEGAGDSSSELDNQHLNPQTIEMVERVKNI